MKRKLLIEILEYLTTKGNEASVIVKSATIYSIDDTKKISRTTLQEEFQKEELEKAWHNKDFEIEMYWNGAAYFWIFIGATFLGYFALISSSGYHEFLSYEFYQVEAFIITIGLIFSMAWYFVNKERKGWQINWEAQVDELENILGRSNYTTIFHNHSNRCYSVSGINQKVSLIVTLIWLLLYCSYWIRWGIVIYQ